MRPACLIGAGQAEELVDHKGLAVELLVDHHAEDAHHSGAAVVELNAPLERLRLRVEVVPSVVEGAIPEVSGELAGSVNVLQDEELKESDEADDLGDAGGGDGVEGAEAGGDGGEGGAGLVDGSGQVDAGAGGELRRGEGT